MASLPLKTISNLIEKASKDRGRWQKAGNAYEAYMYPDGGLRLSHYGTVILDYDAKKGTYQWQSASQSDTQAIKSAIMILGLEPLPKKKSSGKSGSDSSKSTYNSDVVKAVRNRILKEFEDYGDGFSPEEGFVDQIDNLIDGHFISRPDGAIRYWIQGGNPYAYPEDKKAFLDGVGVDSGISLEESDRRFNDLFLREGLNLYSQIVSNKKTRKPAVKNESIKKSLSSARGKVKGSLSRVGTGKKSDGTAVPDAMATGIQAIYYDPAESERFGRDVFDVVISLKGLKKKMWVKDYDPNTGTYKRAYPDQSSADIKTHAKGHVKVRTFVAPSRIPGRFRGSKGVN